VGSDIGIDAAKTGMLASAEIVETVSKAIEAHDVDRLVVDPVMVAKSGDRLLADDAIEALRSRLVPLARVVTPNLHEAGLLLQGEVRRLLPRRAAFRVEPSRRRLVDGFRIGRVDPLRPRAARTAGAGGRLRRRSLCEPQAGADATAGRQRSPR
jgi:hypothetical protein